MKVKDLIEMLQRDYTPEDSLIVATWEKDSFAPLLKEDDDWAEIAQSCMDEVDWGWELKILSTTLNRFNAPNNHPVFSRTKLC